MKGENEPSERVNILSLALNVKTNGGKMRDLVMKEGKSES